MSGRPTPGRLPGGRRRALAGDWRGSIIPIRRRRTKQALQDLENGATGLSLVFAGSIGAYGFGIAASAKRDCARCSMAFISMPAFRSSSISVREAKDAPDDLVDLGAAAWSFARALRHPLRLSIRLARWRRAAPSPLSWREIAPAFLPAASAISPRAGFRGPFAVADGRPIHEAGGSEAQELAFALANAVAYLRALEAGGVGARRCARE